MRDLDGTSRWRNLAVWADGRSLGGMPWPPNGTQVALPRAASLRLSVELQRSETSMTLNLVKADGTILHITLDRNDRQIAARSAAQRHRSNRQLHHLPIYTVPTK